MSLLTQCPRCGFAYVRPRDEATAIITCRRCHCVFSSASGQAVPAPVAAPGAALAAPIVVSSVPPPAPPQAPPPQASPPLMQAAPTQSMVEAETVHEVDDIEVLDPPAERLPPQAQGQSAGLLELGPPQKPPPLDDVEVVEPPPIAPPTVAPVLDAVVLFSAPEPTGVPERFVPLDGVEVLEEPAGAPPNPPTMPAVVVASPPETAHAERPPPVPARYKERVDIRKRDGEAGVPWGVWLGLGIPLLAIALLVVIILVVLRSGRPSPNPQAQPAQQPPAQQQPVQQQPVQQQPAAQQPAAQQPAPQQPAQPAAPIADQFLPRPVDWPTHPDRRGPAPWLPKPSPLQVQPRAADQLPGLIGYWPLDEGKDAQVGDASNNAHKSTLVGGWWIDGVRGKALLFDGQRDYLELGDSRALSFGDNAPFTVAGWIATQQQNGYLLAFRNPKNFAPAIQVKVSGGALCGVVRADGSEFGEARVGLAQVADGRWHHFAVMRHPGGTIETFLDGRSLDKRQGGNTIGPITTMVRAVGCERSWFLSQQAASAYCSCAVDELCVFDRALTTQEIGQLMGKK